MAERKKKNSFPQVLQFVANYPGSWPLQDSNKQKFTYISGHLFCAILTYFAVEPQWSLNGIFRIRAVIKYSKKLLMGYEFERSKCLGKEAVYRQG
jgi:hypothetical protein